MKTNLSPRYILYVLLFLFANRLEAQNPSLKVFEDWNDTVGTQNMFRKNVVRPELGTTNVYVAGATLNAAGNYDLLVTKYNTSGAMLWTQQHNGNGNGDDYALDLQLDNSGNVYVTGTTYENATDSLNAVTIMYDASGNQQWLSTYNGNGSGNDVGAALYVDNSTGEVFVAGSEWEGSSALYDFLVLKYDNSGNQQWAANFDNTNLNDGAIRVTVNPGTGNVEAGGATQTTSTNRKYLVLEVDNSSGSYINHYTSSSNTFGIDNLTDLKVDALGNVNVTGAVLNTTTGFDIRTIKLDTALNVIWSSTYSGSLDDMGNALVVDANNNVIVTGYTNTATQGRNYVTIKYNSAGTQQWAATFNGSANANDSATAIAVRDTNKIYVTGYSYNGSSKDYYTIRYDAAGNEIWGIGFNHLSDRDDGATAIALDTLGNIIVAGQSIMQDGSSTYSTVKYLEKSTLLPKDTLAFTFTNFQFTENRGQLIRTDTSLAPEVKFYTINKNPMLFFTDTSVSYVAIKNDTTSGAVDTCFRVDMKFVNDNTGTTIRPLEIRENYYNFFNPKCPDGLGHVLNYDQLISFNVWNNVDIIYGSNLMGLKYYFVCKAGGGGNPATQIDLKYEGADSVKIGASGELIIYTPLGNIIQPKAAAWQLDANGNYQTLGWQPNYQILGLNEVGFTAYGSFNTALPLVIAVDWGYKSLSPTTNWNQNNVWSTFMEGLDDLEIGLGSTTNSLGQLITTGTSKSWNYPVQYGLDLSFGGAQDVYVTLFNGANDILWSTFLGGFQDEIGYDVRETANSNLLLFGNTASDSFPVTPLTPGYHDNFNLAGDYTYYLCELSSSGNQMLYGTYFGGMDEEFLNWGRSLDIDGSGNIFITGMTRSNSTTEGFPIRNMSGAYNQGTHAGGSQDGFVAKFNSSDSLVWCTYFGGNGYEDVTGMDVEDGDLFITGYTTTTATNTTCVANTSGGFPLCNGGYYQATHQGGGNEAFIARFDTSGVLAWSTFFGGNGDDGHTVLRVKGKEIFLVGSTTTAQGQAPADRCNPSANGTFPLCDLGGAATFVDTLTGSSDLFIAEFDATNNGLVWSTFYGGPGSETPNDLTIDATGNLFIGGLSGGNLASAAINPGNNYYFQPNNADGSGITTDGMIVKVDASSTVVWATLYGGYMTQPTFGNEEIGSLTTTGSSELFITGAACATNFPFRCDLGIAYCHEETNSSFLQSAFCAKFDLTGGVGINEPIKTEANFTVFPNPASDQLTVALGRNIEAGSTFSIYNSLGQMVYTRNLSSSDQNTNFNVDIALLAGGFYTARMSTPSNVSSQKFIKE